MSVIGHWDVRGDGLRAIVHPGRTRLRRIAGPEEMPMCAHSSCARFAVALLAVAPLMPPATVAAQAPRPFPPAALENVQVLPPDAPVGEVIGVMKGFTQALGVRCQFCHVGEEGQPLGAFDFVSDARAPKGIARTMMRMMADVNQRLAAELPAASPAQVTCYTCHQGKAHPVNAPGM